jgi:hypothetical protein
MPSRADRHQRLLTADAATHRLPSLGSQPTVISVETPAAGDVEEEGRRQRREAPPGFGVFRPPKAFKKGAGRLVPARGETEIDVP